MLSAKGYLCCSNITKICFSCQWYDFWGQTALIFIIIIIIISIWYSGIEYMCFDDV